MMMRKVIDEYCEIQLNEDKKEECRLSSGRKNIEYNNKKYNINDLLKFRKKNSKDVKKD